MSVKTNGCRKNAVLCVYAYSSPGEFDFTQGCATRTTLKMTPALRLSVVRGLFLPLSVCSVSSTHRMLLPELVGDEALVC
jgi:hypothetical protein